MKLAVYVSGQGTLLQKLIDSASHEVLYVCSDRICPAIERAVKAGIPIHSHKEVKNLPKPELSILAGFTIPAPLGLEPDQFINVHPALLPAFGGKGMYGHKVFSEVKQSQVNYTGCTVHFCNDNYDDGAIILQAAIQVDPSWSDDEIAEKTHELELPTLLASIEGIEYVAKYCQNQVHNQVDYVRAVHKAATEVVQDKADKRSWAKMGHRALTNRFKDDEMIAAETKRCATIAEEMDRHDVAAVIRGEMQIGDDLISEKGIANGKHRQPIRR